MKKRKYEDGFRMEGPKAARLLSGPPADADWAGPLAADLHIEDDLLAVYLPDRAFDRSWAAAWADDPILAGLQTLMARYPGRRLSFVGWSPSPEWWPRTCQFVASCGASVIIPAEYGTYWDETVGRGGSPPPGEGTGGQST